MKKNRDNETSTLRRIITPVSTISKRQTESDSVANLRDHPTIVVNASENRQGDDLAFLFINNWLAGLCAAAISAAFVVLCARTPSTSEKALAQERASEVARDIAKAEQTLRLQAVREFPGDHWSQGDAYSFREFRSVFAAATREKAAIGSILNALDEYLRKNPNKDNQNRVPICKPRSFYD